MTTIFANNLKKARKAAKITQAELARSASVTQGAINQFESGLSIPSLPTAILLAKALGITLDDLVK